MLADRLPLSARLPGRVRLPRGETYVPTLIFAMLTGLLAGMGLGTVNLFHWLNGSWDVALTQLHGHLQLVGWVGGFVMGIGSHALPRFAGQPLRRPWLGGLATLSLMAGLLLRIPGQLWYGPVWVASASLELVAFTAFGAAMGELLWRVRRGGLYVAFVLSSLAWAWAASAATLALTAQSVHLGVPFLLPAANEAVVLTWLLGFASCMIFAFNLQTLPRFMGARAGRTPVALAALVSANLGVLLLAVGQWTSTEPLSIAGAFAWTLAVLALAWALGLAAPSRPADASGVSFRQFVRVSWFWLILGSLGLCAVHVAGHSTMPQYSAVRHALALGFVTTMIFGYALRIMPVFSRMGALPTWVWRTLLVLQTGGTALRVLHGVLPATPHAVPLGGAALNVGAFLLFLGAVFHLVRHHRKPEESVAVSLPLTPDMNVGAVALCFPQTLGWLVELGFTMLANETSRERVASQVTIRQACLILNLVPDQVVATLNRRLSAGRATDGTEAAPQG